MTAPTAERTAWPGLGFDPAPGNAGQVQHMTRQLDQVARLLGTTHARLADVQAGRGDWQGEGATAFTEKVGPLPRYLDEAATSLGRAHQVLTTWHELLAGLKKQAVALEAQAAAAQQQVTQAEQAANQAGSDPLMGYVGTNQLLPPDLFAKVDAALGRSEAAVATLTKAYESLAELRRQGQVLLDRHDDGAHQAADGLRRADDGLAPPEPGFFENAMGWIKDHLADIADVTGAIAAIAGVIALFPPAAPIAAPVALAAAAVTAGLDIADTAIHDQWRNPDNLKKLGQDAVGLVPGARFVGGIGKALAKGEDIGSLGQRAQRAVVPELWGPARKRAAAGMGIDKAVDRISDIGQEREPIDDWGVGRFRETVDQTADQAHGVIDGVGRIAGSVEREFTGDDASARGLQEKAHDAVDTAADTATHVTSEAGRVADQAVDGLDGAVEGSGIGEPMRVSP
ncbi:MAG: hypothetical protein L0H84_13345, partial [Pseudonocardia sp.]|nr:hypothetical protein [Pseudonocardia sp.]